MTLALELAAYAVRTSFDDLPAPTVEAAKDSILDTLAVAWAGTGAPGCSEVYGVLQSRGGVPESTLWGRIGQLPAPAAALANGMAAAALDYDSMHGGFHADGCTLAAALAIAERQNASGRELLRAFVLGSDLSCRLAAASTVRRWGWWDTPLLGAFGCAVAAGLLLGLDKERIAYAMGLVYARTGGTLQLNVDQSLAKRLAMGQAAEAGVNAALLAQAGITGPREVFEGEFGFSRIYAPIDRDALFDGLLVRFAANEMTFKPYPCCGCTHTAIAAVLSIMEELCLTAKDVTGATAIISPYMDALVGSTFDPEGSQVGAQFSIRYAIACAIHRGGFSLSDLEPAAMRDPLVASRAASVVVQVDPSSDSTRACEISLALAGGTTHRLRLEVAPGSPELPMTPAKHREKVLECFSRGVSPMNSKQIDAVSRQVRDMNHLPHVSGLLKEF